MYRSGVVWCVHCFALVLLGLSQCWSRSSARASCHQSRSDNKSAVCDFADARVLGVNVQGVVKRVHFFALVPGVGFSNLLTFVG